MWSRGGQPHPAIASAACHGVVVFERACEFIRCRADEAAYRSEHAQRRVPQIRPIIRRSRSPWQTNRDPGVRPAGWAARHIWLRTRLRWPMGLQVMAEKNPGAGAWRPPAACHRTRLPERTAAGGRLRRRHGHSTHLSLSLVWGVLATPAGRLPHARRFYLLHHHPPRVQ